MPRPTPTPDILEKEYDDTPYPSFPFSQTHPTHLYTLAKLFGLNPAAVEKAKILEIGCASGGNLIPMAFHFPNATFLGIDLASKQIQEGLNIIKELKIENITLRHQSLLDFNEVEGKFDYIICHGVYSWVDVKAREKILSICKQCLAKEGIAYISYNTLPGWNMINSIRDLMIWHTKNIPDPTTKAQQARAVLNFISEGLQEDKSSYAQVLHNEITMLSKQSDGYLLHDHLSTFNQPIYFHQFMEEANKNHLSYLSDAFLATMFTGNLPSQFSKELDKINNIIVIGQYMDFIRNQRFRCTLLCHEKTTVNRALNTNAIEKFFLQFIGKPDKENLTEKDITPDSEMSFRQGNITLKVRSPLSQLAMLILIEEKAKPIHYNDLCQKLIARSEVKDLNLIKNHLNNELNLMRTVFAGLINISSYPGNYSIQKSEKPIACPLVRFQATRQNYVTNRLHQNMFLDPLSKILLPLLNGENNIESILKIIITQIEEGKLTILDENKQPIKEKEEITKRARIICQNAIEQLAKHALFINPVQ